LPLYKETMIPSFHSAGTRPLRQMRWNSACNA